LTIGDIPMGIAAHRWFTIPVERGRHPNFEAWYARLTECPAFKKNVMRPTVSSAAAFAVQKRWTGVRESST
jgi:glutathione S-transferase